MSTKKSRRSFDVFISYSRSDRVVAEDLYSRLSGDMSVFLDVRSLKPGEDWDREMALAQRSAKVTVILIPRTATEGYYVREEVAAAIALARHDPVRHQVVAIYQDRQAGASSDVPYGLRELESIQLGRGVTLSDAAAKIRSLFLSGTQRTDARSEPRLWNMPSHRPAHFVGREDLFSALQHRLQSAPLSKPQVLLGVAGVGKTSLAVEYAHRNLDRFSVVWWIRAENEDFIARDLAALAPGLGVSVERGLVETALSVKTKLAELNEPWLLVFDGAPGPDVLSHWVPQSVQGQVLITSRRRGWGTFADELSVDTLDMQTAADLLLGRTNLTDEDGARRLASRLGGHPLALELAAAYLKNTHQTFEDYERRMDQLDLTVDGSIGDGPRSLRASMEFALSAVERADPGAIVLLQRLSLMAPGPLPLWILEGDQDPGWRPSQIAHAVQSLSSVGMLRTIERSMVSVHAMVQDAVRSHMSPSTLRGRVDEVVSLLLVAFPKDTENPEVWPLCAELLPHVLAVVGWGSEKNHPRLLILLDETATYATSTGNTPESKEVLQALAAAARRVAGDESPITVSTVSRLAAALRATGELQEARRLQEGVLEILRRVRGSEDSTTLASMSSLAGTLRAMGDLLEARRLQQQVLEKQRQILGVSDPATLASMSSLAWTLRLSGEVSEALALQREVLNRQREILGEDHPATLPSMNNLAGMLREIGQLDEAQRIQEEVVIRQSRLFGEEHPDTLASMNNLGATLLAKGHIDGARAIYERALAASWSKLGREHPDALTTMNNLAFTLSAGGDKAGARALHEQALEAYRRLFGDEHPSTLASMNNLAELFREMADLDSALGLHERVLAALTRILGDDHPATLTSMNNVASTLYDMGQVRAARDLYERVVEGRRRILGEEHPDTRAVARNLAQTLRS